jgi:hypothetical protein
VVLIVMLVLLVLLVLVLLVLLVLLLPAVACAHVLPRRLLVVVRRVDGSAQHQLLLTPHIELVQLRAVGQRWRGPSRPQMRGPNCPATRRQLA